MCVRCAVIGCGKVPADNQTFLLLELCSEGSLAALLASPEPLPWSLRLSLLVDVTEGRSLSLSLLDAAPLFPIYINFFFQKSHNRLRDYIF